MAEKQVINFKKSVISNKKFGSETIRIKKYLDNEDISVAVLSALNSGVDENKITIEDQSAHNTHLGLDMLQIQTAISVLDLTIIVLTTNVEIADIEYKQLVESGFINFMRESVLNYQDARDVLMATINQYNLEQTFVGSSEMFEDGEQRVDDLINRLSITDPKLIEAILNNKVMDSIRLGAQNDMKEKSKKEVAKKNASSKNKN